MSRTDKDKPIHARAQWWQPSHWRCEYATSQRWRNYWDDRRCDLPAEPDPSSYDRTAKFGRAGCTWEPVWDRHHQPAPPGWYVDHVWNEPQRTAVRMFGRRAIAEWRATGDVDLDEPNWRHRNCAKWMWW